MLQILLLILTSTGFASDWNGQWSGRGNCYLSRDPGLLSTCDYSLFIQRTNQELSIRNCVVWQQEWGEGRECLNGQYEIRQDHKLWRMIQNRMEEVGEISPQKIEIKASFSGGSSSETYLIDQESNVLFTVDHRNAGAWWLYRAKLSPR